MLQRAIVFAIIGLIAIIALTREDTDKHPLLVDRGNFHRAAAIVHPPVDDDMTEVFAWKGPCLRDESLIYVQQQEIHPT